MSELMQQALEALENAEDQLAKPYSTDARAAIAALQARLAQPEPAPGYCQHCKQYTIEEPLPAQPEQEPVAWMQEMPTKGDETRSVRLTTVEALAREEWPNPIPLYTAPPRREWVGLTEEEVYPLANAHLRYQPESYSVSGIYDLARAIEAKLKEKNQ